jgi:hypothetical protein
LGGTWNRSESRWMLLARGGADGTARIYSRPCEEDA